MLSIMTFLISIQLSSKSSLFKNSIPMKHSESNVKWQEYSPACISLMFLESRDENILISGITALYSTSNIIFNSNAFIKYLLLARLSCKSQSKQHGFLIILELNERFSRVSWTVVVRFPAVLFEPFVDQVVPVTSLVCSHCAVGGSSIGYSMQFRPLCIWIIFVCYVSHSHAHIIPIIVAYFACRRLIFMVKVSLAMSSICQSQSQPWRPMCCSM